MYCLTVVHGACDGVLMTVLFGVVTILIPSPEAHGPLWALTNLAVGVGQVTGLPIAGKQGCSHLGVYSAVARYR